MQRMRRSVWKRVRRGSRGSRYFRQEVRSPTATFYLGKRRGSVATDDARGEELATRRADRSHPDWRTVEGMARGGESLTKALLEQRAAERAHDDARAQGDRKSTRLNS